MPLRTVLALTDADRRRLGRDGLLAWVAALPLVMAVAVRAGLPPPRRPAPRPPSRYFPTSVGCPRG